MKPLVIYHSNCPDGWTAAWVAARALGEAELYPGEYGKPPPYDLAKGRRVYIVDFSYPREQLEILNEAARTFSGGAAVRTPWMLQVLDHHKSAQAALAGLPYCIFDMERSGAGLTWDYFYPDEPRPWLVDFVEDRDLWRFALPHSREISLLIRATPHTLEAWDDLAKRTFEPDAGISPSSGARLVHDPDGLLPEAAGCKRYLDHYVHDALRQAYTFEHPWPDPDEPDDFRSWRTDRFAAVNVCFTGRSDVQHALLERFGTSMAISWHLRTDGTLDCGIASTRDMDCSKVARWLGGGGHAQASGFRLKLNHPLAQQLLRAGQ